jgi:D-arabinose 1-dehydrogenase-like Zn-dependent alcohol dehydrogenase
MKEPVPEEALFAFLLTCGLSAVEAAGLEIGDTAVITGSGSLAQSILAAALLQGARCVSFASQRREGELFETPGKQVRAAVLRAEELRTANPPSQRFVMWETTGEPETLDLLVPQLGPRGKLILCRGDKSCAAQLDCYRDLHKTSAVIESWNPASPAMLPSWRDCYRRAACLTQYKRVLKGRAWQTSP